MSTAKIRPATHTRIYEAAPQVSEPLSRTWITRGANFVITTSELEDGATLVRDNNPDEYMVYMMHGAATISAGDESITAAHHSVTIVPPGPSTITARGRASVVRVLSNHAKDLAALADNAQTYADGAPEAAPLTPWPDPIEGFRLRNYDPASYTLIPGSRWRLFRCTNIMLNLTEPRPLARDTRQLSPHSHDDYEQATLVVEGDYAHHLRYPWGSDMSDWREDEHIEIGSPSTLVVPANVIHTSRNLNNGWHIDIFAPPRIDFAKTPGLVLNEKDYPLPPAGTQ